MALKHGNAAPPDRGEQVVQSLRRVDVVRNQVIHLVVGEIALFVSRMNEFRDVVESQAESFFSATCTEQGLVISGKT